MRFPLALQPSWGLTVLRVIVGITFAMHGWQKFSGGVAGVTGFFTSLGIPGAGIMAPLVIALELLGGIALIVGFGTRWISVPLAINMLVALFTVHLSKGFFAQAGGYELVLLLFAASVTFILAGGGALALDDAFTSRTRSRTPARSV